MKRTNVNYQVEMTVTVTDHTPSHNVPSHPGLDSEQIAVLVQHANVEYWGSGDHATIRFDDLAELGLEPTVEVYHDEGFGTDPSTGETIWFEYRPWPTDLHVTYDMKFVDDHIEIWDTQDVED